MRKIKKAVIPAAGWGTRSLPATKSIPKGMLPIVDKPAIQYIVEEALEAGIEEIAIVTGGNAQAIERHFQESPELESVLIQKNNKELLDIFNRIPRGNIHFIEQKPALGLGHSVWCARHFIGDEPFAVLLGDVLCDGPGNGIQALMDVYQQKQAGVIGVQPVPWSEVGIFGVITGEALDARLYALKELVEKPQGQPPSNLAIMGRYILDPHIFEMIELTAPDARGEIQLTNALQRQLGEQEIFAYTIEDQIYDVGSKLGFLKATVEMAFKHDQLKGEFGHYLHRLVAGSGAPLIEEERR